MPKSIQELLSTYSSEKIRKALEKHGSNRKDYAVRDATRVHTVNEQGFIPAKEKPIYDRGDVRFDDGPMGFVPVIGDVLQGGQAIKDFFNGDYGKAALGAGMLFVPNAIEKSAKPFIKQLLKDGTQRVLRHAPARTIGLEDAVSAPYKGQNFLHHDVDLSNVADVLRGETRAISPSFAVNRWGDYNEKYTPGYYGQYVFLDDKSVLDNSLLFRGDGDTGTVGDVFYGATSVPSDMREQIAEDVWDYTTRNSRSGLLIAPSELEKIDVPNTDYYFEAKYHGLYPLDRAKIGIFPVPESTDNPALARKIHDAFNERGLKINTYDRRLSPYMGYDDKAEVLLKTLNENQDLLFKDGGKIYIKPSHRGRLTELKARTGKTEAELYNDGNPAHKRMVVFARNARKWSHADGGLIETPEKTEYANKWDSISNARYGMANDALLRSGSNAKDADRLARFLATQSALEAGWVDTVKGNNYAGYMSNGKRMSFNTTDDFWDYHIKNLDERWPEWRKAQTIDDYYNTINNTALGLTTKELFDEYNRNHRDNPAYIYAPDWQNENYLKKLQSIYNKYISTYVKPMFDAGGMLKRMSSIYKTKEEMLAAIERAKASK